VTQQATYSSFKEITMALPHAKSGHPVSVLPNAADLAAWQSTAIFKTDKLEVMRLMLAKGKSMPAHQVAGDITIHCLSGAIALAVGDELRTLAAGQMVYLAGGVVHSLVATEDTCALVHIVLHAA
jgi:quercetin dioxygenase-like cupin family protein